MAAVSAAVLRRPCCRSSVRPSFLAARRRYRLSSGNQELEFRIKNWKLEFRPRYRICWNARRAARPPSSFRNRTSTSPTWRCATRCRPSRNSLPLPASAAAIASASRCAQRAADDRVVSRRVAVAGTAAPLNPAYTEEEFRFYLEDTGARKLIPSAGRRRRARRAAGDRVPVLTIDMDAAGTVTLSGRVRRIARRAVPAPSIDVALVLHTSGSTGRPKRVPLSARQPVHLGAATSRAATRSAPSDVSLCVMPLFHVHGLVASTLATLVDRRHRSSCRAKFSPLSFWRVARDHGVTWYSAVPTLHQLLLARAADPDVAPAGGHRTSALHPVVQRVAAAAGDARPRSGVRRAGRSRPTA